MTEEAWSAGYARCLGVRLAGDLIGDVDERGEPIVGDTILLLLNAHHEAIPFTLPPAERAAWERCSTQLGRRLTRYCRRRSSTSCRPCDGRCSQPEQTAGTQLQGRSMAVAVRTRRTQAQPEC